MVELFTGRIQHFVFTSSSAVYRRSFVQPVLETFRTHDPDDADPRKAYGVGKVQLRAVPARPVGADGLAGDEPAGRAHARSTSPLASPTRVLRPAGAGGRSSCLVRASPFVHLVHVPTWRG